MLLFCKVIQNRKDTDPTIVDSSQKIEHLLEMGTLYLTHKDIESLSIISHLIGKRIDVKRYFCLYVMYEMFLSKHQSLSHQEKMKYIKDELFDNKIDYDTLKSHGVTDKAIFIFFLYPKILTNQSIEHLIPTVNHYFERKYIQQKTRPLTNYVINIKSRNLQNKPIYEGNIRMSAERLERLHLLDTLEDLNISDQITYTNMQKTHYIKLTDLNQQTEFVNGYFVDIVYVKNGDTQNIQYIVNNNSSYAIINRLHAEYGDNVTKQQRFISENSVDRNILGIIGGLYHRSRDGVVFEVDDNTVCVVVVHKHVTIPKEYHRKTSNNTDSTLRKIAAFVSQRLNSRTS